MDSAALREPIELVFGDQRFKIEPFTIDQVEMIEAISYRVPPLTDVQRAKELVRVALFEGHHDVDVGKLKADLPTLFIQAAKILPLAGFKAAEPGEAAAAAGKNAPVAGGTSEAA